MYVCASAEKWCGGGAEMITGKTKIYYFLDLFGWLSKTQVQIKKKKLLAYIVRKKKSKGISNQLMLKEVKN